MPRKKKQNYVDNDRLREMIVRYNDTNPNETGEFLDKYESTMKKKGKYQQVKDWIRLRREKYAKERPHTPEFDRLAEELFASIDTIVRRRVACFVIPESEKEDLIQECLLIILTYINRYREDIETSAFAYVTQLINNAVKLYMGQDNDSRWCRQPWNDISDECISLIYGVEEKNEEGPGV